MRSLGSCFLLLAYATAAAAADPNVRLIEKQAILPIPRAEAWHYWTTNDGFQKSVGVPGSDIQLKLGGKYEIYFAMTAPVGQRGSEGSTVLTYHPLEMLAFTWNAPPSIPELRSAGAMTHVVVRFKDVPDGTLVQLTQVVTGRGPAWDKYIAYFENAWPNVLKHMQAHAQKSDRPTKDVAAPPALNPLIHEAIIDATPAEVWKAFTTREGIESWMVAKGSVDLKVQGKMLTTYNKNATLGDENTIENTIRAYVPERMLSVQCTKTPQGFQNPELFVSTWTVLYFEPVNDKQTKVRCIGLNYGDDEKSKAVRKHFETGNAYVLNKLQQRFAVKK